MSALTKITVPDGTTYEFKDALALRAAAAAPEFVESVPYGVGDYCSHDGLVYRCSAAHAAGAWNASHFTVMGPLQTQIDGKVAKDGGSAQQTISLSSGSGTTALGVRSRSTSSYISFTGTSGWLGSYGVTSNKKPTFYNGSSYTLATTDDIPAISTNIATDASSDAKAASPKAVKTFVEGKGYLTQHQDVSGKLDGAAAYPAWSSSVEYEPGAVVSHLGRLWRFPSSSPVTIEGSIYEPVNGEAASSWTEVTVASLLAESRYVLPAATVSTLGGVKPDGTTITVSDGVISVVGGGGGGGGIDPRYTFASPEVTVSGTAATVAQLTDRAVNEVTLGSTVTSVAFTFPAATTGKVRDFFVRLVVQGSTPPTVVFTEPGGGAVAFDVEDTAWADIEPGVNVLMFTDTAE